MEFESGPEDAHIPVMAEEVLEYLNLTPGASVLDGTVGLGGHSSRIAARLGAGGRLIGLDRDPAALEAARVRLADAECGVTLCHERYSQMQSCLDRLGMDGVDGILLDIGVSSLQLDTPERGFSFRHDAPLDMRMDPTRGRTAADVVNTEPEEELARILFEFGEERKSRRIAKQIVDERATATIEGTGRLAAIVAGCVPRSGRIHPATRTFQALRIEVNDELGELTRGLKMARRCLKPGGRLVVLTFHSLEDRIVKRFMRAWAEKGVADLVRRKVVKPGREECARNPRARSAKLRVCEIPTDEAE